MKHLAGLFHAAAFAAAVMSAAAPARAGDIITDWATAKAPPVPELKPASVDPATTALLVLDFMKNNCGARPRCIATVPNVKKLIDAARTHNLMLLYTFVGRDLTAAGMVDQTLAPRAGETVVTNSNGGDKFIGTSLDQALKDKGIRTLIITGTSAQGAVGSTTSSAAQRGYKIIVPVDGMSSDDAYNEQYAAWNMYKGGPAVLVNNTTLTRSDMIRFGS